jgi:outer membrane protein TolC
MKWLVALTSLLMLPALAAAQGEVAFTDGVLTLEQAVTMALQQNRDVQSAALEVGKAEDLRRARQTARFPSLEVGVAEVYALTPLDLKFKTGDLGTIPGVGPIPAENTTISNTNNWQTLPLATVTQPLSQQYKIGLQIEQAAVQKALAGSSLQLTQSTTVAGVKEAYYQVLMAQTALEAAEEYVQALRELERVVVEQVQREAALRADLLDVQSRRTGAEASALSARNTLATAKERLNLWLGRALDTDYRVTPVPAAPGAEPQWEEARSRALSQRPEVARARLTLQAAETDVKLKWAEYIPDLNLMLAYTSQVTNQVLPKNVGFVGIVLKWEFFDWGR